MSPYYPALVAISTMAIKIQSKNVATPKAEKNDEIIFGSFSFNLANKYATSIINANAKVFIKFPKHSTNISIQNLFCM